MYKDTVKLGHIENGVNLQPTHISFIQQFTEVIAIVEKAVIDGELVSFNIELIQPCKYSSKFIIK